MIEPVQCKACGAPMIWARTGSGKAMPLDAQPNPAGNVELIGDSAKVWGTSHVWPPEQPRFMPHHATCPSWRR
jgi:hypothetical protein